MSVDQALNVSMEAGKKYINCCNGSAGI